MSDEQPDYTQALIRAGFRNHPIIQQREPSCFFCHETLVAVPKQFKKRKEIPRSYRMCPTCGQFYEPIVSKK